MNDVVELLLPAASAPVAARARAVVTFLRLVHAHAQDAGQQRVAVSLDRARREADELERVQLQELIEDALWHQLAELVGEDSFLRCGRAGRTASEAWLELALSWRQGRGRADFPAPGGGRIETARALLDALQSQHAEAATIAYWQACLARAERGPQAGEQAFLALLSEHRAGVSPPPARLIAGAVACLLDRGAVRVARALLQENLGAAAADPELARLLCWTQALCGEARAAQELARSLKAPDGPLPLALRELAADGLALPFALPEPAAAQPPGGAGAPSAALQRSEVGAAALVAFRLQPSGEVELVGAEAARALRARVRAWSIEREGTHRLPGEPEHELVATGRMLRQHRGEHRELRGALCGADARAQALVPLLGTGKCVLGWVRVEFEHHALPTARRLEALAEAWRQRVLETRGSEPTAAASAPEESDARALAEPALEAQLPAAADPRRECLRELVARLGMKLGQRRWWAFELHGERMRLLEADGGELGDWSERRGGARALERARACQGVVSFEDPDPELSFHRDSASGVVLPLLRQAQVVGLVVVESLRRRDFRPVDVERWSALVRAAGAALQVAQFRAWYWKRHGHDVHFDAEGAGLAGMLLEFLAAGRARRPVALCGAPGTGKRIVARWLHFEGERRNAAFARFHCAVVSAESGGKALFGGRGKPGLWDAAAQGTLLLEHLPSLPMPLQHRLLQYLDRAAASEGAGASPRLIATMNGTLDEMVAAGGIANELAQRFGSLQFMLPPLARRRDEIPALAKSLLARLAREEGRGAPELADSALACLWRQEWPGNVRQIEQFLYRVLISSPPGVLEAAELEKLAALHGLTLAPKLPPRQADRELVLMALRTTRKQNGTPNKSRAAMYLGWDPDTISARMQELGVVGADDAVAVSAAPLSASKGAG